MDFKINSLIGYYFEDEYFEDVLFISPTINKKLNLDKTDLPDICLNKKIKSARWVGFIKPVSTGDYIIYTDVSNCIVQVDEKILTNSSLQPISIHLEQGKEYKIRIEQQLVEGEVIQNYKGITLIWKSAEIDEEVVPDESLRNPDYSNINEENEFIPNDNFFFAKRRKRAIDDTRDSDRDGIPDSFEIEGYTVINLVVTKWEDELAEQGYKKYVSNPYRARTANDPYTDFEKVSGRIDPSVSLIARDPMVAAYPIIRVAMEKLVVSKNSTIDTSQGSSMSKTSSSETSNSNQVGVNVTTEAGYDVLPKFNVSVSANYSHTWQTSNSVANTNQNSFTNGLSINTGQSAYINPNIRYYNTGTAPVYNVSPNITVSIDGDSIASVQAQANQIGGYLNPDKCYPAKGLAPIAFNTIDQFNSHLIAINYNQLQAIDKGESVDLSVSQFTGNFAKIGINGELITTNNDWSPYLGTIESSTASIIFESDQITQEIRIAARNEKDVNDLTPNLTIIEALGKVYDIKKIGDQVIYKGKVIPENALSAIKMDNKTKSNLDNQLKAMERKNFLDCFIFAGMNITVSIKDLVIHEYVDYINDTKSDRVLMTSAGTIVNRLGLRCIEALSQLTSLRKLPKRRYEVSVKICNYSHADTLECILAYGQEELEIQTSSLKDDSNVVQNIKFIFDITNKKDLVADSSIIVQGKLKGQAKVTDFYEIRIDSIE